MVELRQRHRANSRSVDDISINTKKQYTNGHDTQFAPDRNQSKVRSNSTLRKQGRLESIVTWQSLGILFLVVSLTGFSLNVSVEILRNELSDYDTILFISLALLFVILAVPLTYFIVGWYRFGRKSMNVSNWSFVQPMRGGLHFVILQACAWTLYGIVIVLIVWVAITGAKSIASGVLATIGFTGVIAQLLILVSLQFFVAATNDATASDVTISTDTALTKKTINAIIKRQKHQLGTEPISAPLSKKHRKTSLDVLSEVAEKIQHERTESPVKPTTTNRLIDKLPIILSIISAVLTIAVESLELSTGANVSLRSVAICGLLIAVPMTHVLVATKYSAHSIITNKQLSAYKLFQPTSGGKAFISLQALGWAVWTMALLASIFSLYLNTNNLNVKGMFTVGSIGGILSQIFVLLSLRYFDNSLSKQIQYVNKPKLQQQITKQLQDSAHLSEKEANAAAIVLLNETDYQHTATARFTLRQLYDTVRQINKQTIIEHLRDIRALCIITAFFLSPMFSLSCLLSPIGLTYTLYKNGLSLIYALLPSIILVVLYSRNYLDAAHKTGERMWPAFRYNDVMWSDFARYFRARVIPAGTLHKTEQYIFCFSPHGIYPMSTVWSTLCPQWYAAYDIDVNVAGASVMFYVPIIRELVLWSGGLDVSRDSVECALKQSKNVLLIPGGQREMRYSKSSKNKIILVNRHKGFCKLAIQHGCKLVPVFSFGEHELMDNVYLPDIQHFTTRYIGYMFPMWPYGRWYSPLPNRVQLTFAVGEPVDVMQNHTPTQAEIDDLHQRYYERLTELFYAKRDEAGYPELELVLKNH